MSTILFEVAHLILDVTQKPSSAETEKKYQQLFTQMGKLPLDQVDTVFKFIALLLNSSNQLVSLPTKFRCVYFLKFATAPGTITDYVKQSLPTQKYLLRTLLRFALHNKNKDFPSRGKGLFLSTWPSQETTDINISNNLIGLTLELLKYWGQNHKNDNIFGEIYQDLMNKYQLIYPDYEVYFHGRDYTTAIDWTSPKSSIKSLPMSDLLQKDEEFPFNWKGSAGESEIAEMMKELESKFLKKIIKLMEKSKKREKSAVVRFRSIIKGLIKLQTVLNYLKKCFSSCSILEVSEEIYKVCTRARSFNEKFEEIIKFTFEFLRQSDQRDQDFEEYSEKLASLQIEDVPTAIRGSAIQQEEAFTQTENTSPETKKVPLQIEEIKGSAIQQIETFTQTENTSLDIKETSIQTEDLPEQPDGSSLQSNENSKQGDIKLELVVHPGSNTGSSVAKPLPVEMQTKLRSPKTSIPKTYLHDQRISCRDRPKTAATPTSNKSEVTIEEEVKSGSYRQGTEESIGHLESPKEEIRKKHPTLATSLMLYNNKRTIIYSFSGKNQCVVKDSKIQPGCHSLLTYFSFFLQKLFKFFSASLLLDSLNPDTKNN